MRRFAFAFLCLILLLISTSQIAQAWNKPGHMVTGAIAYKELMQSNPALVKQVVLLLEHHPFYETLWKPQIEKLNLQGQDRDLFLFAFAARWPDDARGTPFHHERWHFINFPFKPADQPASVKPLEPVAENIIEAFKQNLAVLHSQTASDEEKSIAICWVFHLIGDVHQPLHTSAFFSTVFPQGDQGGNLWFIRVSPTGAAIRLHSFWDGLILSSDDVRDVSQRAIVLRSNPDLGRDKLPELSEISFEKWASVESFNAAVKVAYREGTLPMSKDQAQPAAAPADYVQMAEPVAQRRVVLAGYRIADLLAEVFSPAPTSALPKRAPAGAPAAKTDLVLGNPSGATDDPSNKDDFLLEKPQYVLSYNNSKGTPNWVAWHLQSSDIGDADRKKSPFHPDNSLPSGFKRVTPTDYIGSGFDRGHMCNSADRSNMQANNEATFAMSNMQPQTPDLNRHIWGKLEAFSRALAGEGNELYIYAGCRGSAKTIGKANTVTVPTDCWKVIVVLSQGRNDLKRIDENTRVIAVDIPNKTGISKDRWQKYIVSVRDVESATGYDFLSTVSKGIQDAIETKKDSGK